jgi:hypothetical protein
MAQHRGRRSEFNEQRRFAKTHIANSSRQDRIRAERICMMDKKEISEALKKRFPSVIVAADCFEKGEVIVDSRGNGTFQLPNNYRDWELAIF